MKRKTETYLLIVLILALIGAVSIVVRQQQRLERLAKQAATGKSDGLLPVLRETSQTHVIAARKVMSILPESEKIDTERLQKIKGALVDAFGEKVKLLIFDQEMQASVNNNLRPNEVTGWKRALKLFYSFHSAKPAIYVEATALFLQRHFGSNFKLNYLTNYINIFESAFEASHGLVIFGHLVNPKMNKISIGRRSRQAKGESLNDNFQGSLMIFVPEEIYSQKAWLKKNTSSILADADGKILAGSRDEIITGLEVAGLSAAAGKFADLSQKKGYASFYSDSRGFCFNTSKYNSAEKKAEFFVLFYHESNMSLQKRIYAFLVGMAICMLLILGFLLLNNLTPQRLVRFDLAGHFIVLASGACLLPLGLLLFQGISQWQTDSIEAESRIYKELDAKMVTLENSYSSYLIELLTQLGLFQHRIEELKEFSSQSVQRLTEGLNAYDVHQVFVAHDDGRVESFNGTPTAVSEATRVKETTRIMKMLMKFVSQSIRFGKKREKIDVKEGIILEAITEALGVANLYALALRNSQLITFRMLHGAVWMFTSVQKIREEGERLLLFIIHRSRFHQQIVDKWQYQKEKSRFRLFFADQNFSYLRKHAPITLEREPGIAEVLRALNSSGGLIKTRLKIGNDNVYCSARRIKDMEWAMAVMLPEGEAGKSSSGYVGLLVVSILYLGFAICLTGYYFFAIFIKPVRKLSSGVLAMASGNYDLQMLNYSADEIGSMCQSFNSMAQSLKQKEFLSLFLSELAKDAISEKSSNIATRIEGTVLFTDIRGFTTLSESHPPEAIVAMLNDFMTRMEQAIESESGSIEKFIGDAIMAVFLPSHGARQPAIRAIAAAEKMMLELNAMNLARAAEGLFQIDIGVGIASGQLLMGTIGSETGRRDYSVTGKIVMVAAAMEKLTRQVGGKKIVLCPVSAKVVKLDGVKIRKVVETEAFELL